MFDDGSGGVHQQCGAGARPLAVASDVQVVDEAAPPRVVIEHDVDEADQPVVVLGHHGPAVGRGGQTRGPDGTTVSEDVTFEEGIGIGAAVVPAPAFEVRVDQGTGRAGGRPDRAGRSGVTRLECMYENGS